MHHVFWNSPPSSLSFIRAGLPRDALKVEAQLPIIGIQILDIPYLYPPVGIDGLQQLLIPEFPGITTQSPNRPVELVVRIGNHTAIVSFIL